MAATKTSTVTAHIDPDTKRSAEEVFRELHLTASQAITLFYRQVTLQRRLPFAAETLVPNQATREAIEEAHDRKRLARFDTTESLYDDLGI
jgi:DNA-damage-inducible protein J